MNIDTHAYLNLSAVRDAAALKANRVTANSLFGWQSCNGHYDK
jgi:hypothetical protein